jgi:uracil-DNA glycosylase family 4
MSAGPGDERRELLAQLVAHGRFLGPLAGVGVRWPPDGAPAGDSASAPSDPAAAASASGDRSGEDAAATASLDAIRESLGDCRRCKLAAGRKTIVFGQGNPHAELMFVGEAPGAEEDEQGLAFVGRAGQLLTDIIEKGLRMRRGDVFIANVIKCRPPQNRNPEPDEILSCQPFLEAQIRSIRPRVLVGLGKFGAQWLLKTAQPITRLRGRVGEYEGIAVMPTYHPAYLLRNPAAKKDLWEDMKEVLRLLDRPAR